MPPGSGHPSIHYLRYYMKNQPPHCASLLARMDSSNILEHPEERISKDLISWLNLNPRTAAEPLDYFRKFGNMELLFSRMDSAV